MKFTICGSSKPEQEWHEWNKKLGLAGHIAYSLSTFPSVEGCKVWYTPDQKETLDLGYLLKIVHSDAVLMLNKNRYLGESSLRELKWARMNSKKIFWLELTGQMNDGESLIEDFLK